MNIKTETTTVHKLLRVNIDSKWNALEFSTFFETVSFLYQLCYEIDSIETNESQYLGIQPDSMISRKIFNINGDLYKRLEYANSYENENDFDNFYSVYVKGRQQYIEFNDIQVKEIKFSSPGFTDFIGVGKIIEQVFSLIRYYFPNKTDRLNNKLLEHDIILKKIQTLQIMGYSKKEIRKYSNVHNNVVVNLKELHKQDKITSFEIKDLN